VEGIRVAARRRTTYDEDDCVVDHFQRVHEFGLVWALKVQELAALAGDPGRLGRAIIRIHFSGAGQSGRSNEWPVPQLKIFKSASRSRFALFRSLLKWNYCVAYALIVGAVFFAFNF
jgi:hypothetical protein